MHKDIFGMKVKYIRCEMDDNDDGEFIHSKKLIKINKDITDLDILERVTLHEELHGIITRIGISSAIGPTAEETLCDAISMWVTENYYLLAK